VPDEVPTDVQANRDHYITITPLHYNLTSPSGLKVMQQWAQGFPQIKSTD